MRRRLVHEQQVRRVEQQPHQRQAALFPAAEHAHGFKDIIPVEEEAAQQRARQLLPRPARQVHGGLQHRVPHVQHIPAVLREVARLHIMPQLPFARLRRQGPGHELQERGLPRPVRPHQHQALAALHLEVQPLIHRRLRVAKGHPFEREHALPAARRLRKAELHRLRRRLGRVHPLHAVNHFQLVLRARGEVRLRLEAVRPLLQLGDLPLLVFKRRHHLLLPRRLLPQVIIIVSPVAMHLGVRDLQDGVRQRVEEGAVVRDHQNRPRIAPQVVLKPQQRLQIQVVRRLVQQQQVRLLHQQARQVRAHHPAAAQRARAAVEVALAEGQPAQDALRQRLRLPAVVLVAMARRQLQHRHIIHRRALLRQEAKVQPLLHRHQPLVRRALLQQQGEKRGLPRPVRPDQPDLVPAVDVKRHAAEQSAARVGLGDIRDRKHGGAEQCAEWREGQGVKTAAL